MHNVIHMYLHGKSAIAPFVIFDKTEPSFKLCLAVIMTDNQLLPKALPESPLLDPILLGKVDQGGDGQHYHLANHSQRRDYVYILADN